MTRSLSAALVGVQEPRLRSHPPFATSAVEEAVALAASAGLHLDPWQQLSLEVMLGERPDGSWASFEVAELVARQNGKGSILEARELAGLFLLGERLMLHSAHEFKTSKEAYLRIKGLIEGAPHLLRLVKRRGGRIVGFRQSNEDTSIELESGARLRFMARSRSSGRGFSAQTLIVDEAQILSSAAMGALMPTLAAQTNPQIIYTGTVPRPEDDSEHFTSLRNRGRSGGDPSLAWLEWNSGVVADLDDRSAWAAANPALGYRVSESFVEKERLSLKDEDFARERLSIWADVVAASPFADRWGSLVDPLSGPSGAVALAVDVTPERSRASIGAFGVRPDELGHAELTGRDGVLDNKEGTGWVVPRLVQLRAEHEMACGVVLDSSGPAGSLLPELERAKVPVVDVAGREFGQACGAFHDDVMESRVFHLGQHPLSAAVAAARKQPAGDAWKWSRRDSTDISPLVAVTLARHGFMAHRMAKTEAMVMFL